MGSIKLCILLVSIHLSLVLCHPNDDKYRREDGSHYLEGGNRQVGDLLVYSGNVNEDGIHLRNVEEQRYRFCYPQPGGRIRVILTAFDVTDQDRENGGVIFKVSGGAGYTHVCILFIPNDEGKYHYKMNVYGYRTVLPPKPIVNKGGINKREPIHDPGFITVKYPTKEGVHHIKKGERQKGDEELYNDAMCETGPSLKSVTRANKYCYPGMDSKEKISVTSFEVHDLIPENKGGLAYIASGGVGQSQVCVFVKSNWAGDYNFQLVVYGTRQGRTGTGSNVSPNAGSGRKQTGGAGGVGVMGTSSKIGSGNRQPIGGSGSLGGMGTSSNIRPKTKLNTGTDSLQGTDYIGGTVKKRPSAISIDAIMGEYVKERLNQATRINRH